ncbi:MAG: hypothetical protein ACLUIX_10175 [Oscillospiraceae bacterium]
MDAAKVVTKLERIEYVEDPHLGKGSYCVVEMHADVGACACRTTPSSSSPATSCRERGRHHRPGIDEAIQACRRV